MRLCGAKTALRWWHRDALWCWGLTTRSDGPRGQCNLLTAAKGLPRGVESAMQAGEPCINTSCLVLLVPAGVTLERPEICPALVFVLYLAAQHRLFVIPHISQSQSQQSRSSWVV